MINLKIINNFLLKNILILFISLFFLKSLFSNDNKIIFKINDKAFTTFDYQMRIQYLDFVGNNEDLNDEVIINDFISANIFYEYYLKNFMNKTNYEKKINEIFANIEDINKKNNKKYNYKINKQNIILNIKLDYIRKIILENILNSNIDDLNISNEVIDLLYNFKLRYINFAIKDDDEEIKTKIYKKENMNIDSIISILNKKNIEFFLKEKEINNINALDKRIKSEILSNGNNIFIQKFDQISIIFIEKEFETLNGLVANIYSVRSKNKIDNESLKCNNLITTNKFDVIKKEYKFINLNNELKNNLVNINDYVNFLNDNEHVYIVLCDIKFDKEILNNFNMNKLINTTITDIEKKFINKYARIYNLIKLNV